MIFRRYSASNGNFTPADLFNINKSNGCAIIITGNTKYPQNLPLKITPSTAVSSSCFKNSTYLAYFQAKRPSDSLPTTPPNKRHMRYLSSIDNHELFFIFPKVNATTVDGWLTLAPGAQFSFVTQTPHKDPSSREPLFLKSSCNSNKKTRVIPDKSNNTTASSLEKM